MPAAPPAPRDAYPRTAASAAAPSPGPRPAPAPAPSSSAPRAAASSASRAASGAGSGGAAGGSAGNANPKEGVEVPTIHLRPWSSRDEMVAVATYFGMQLWAYPDSKSYYVLFQIATGQFEKSTDFSYLNVFSNRMLVEDGPICQEIKRKTCIQLQAAPETMTMAFLLPHKTANYFAWKEVGVCRNCGLDPAQVKAVVARFVRAGENRDKWNLFVEELILKDGRTVGCGEAENKVAP
jgi:hypothetical protein